MNENELKTVKNIKKIMGPYGGFHYLSFEYIDDNGIRIYHYIHTKETAEIIENLFIQNKLPIITIIEDLRKSLKEREFQCRKSTIIQLTRKLIKRIDKKEKSGGSLWEITNVKYYKKLKNLLFEE